MPIADTSRAYVAVSVLSAPLSYAPTITGSVVVEAAQSNMNALQAWLGRTIELASVQAMTAPPLLTVVTAFPVHAGAASAAALLPLRTTRVAFATTIVRLVATAPSPSTLYAAIVTPKASTPLDASGVAAHV